MDRGLSQQQFATFRNEVNKIINRAPSAGRSGNRFGLAQFGEDVKVEFLLNAHDTKPQILKAFKDFRLVSQPTKLYLGRALRYAANNFFTPEAGGRAHQGAQQILIVAQSRESDDPVSQPAKYVKSFGVELGRMGPPGTIGGFLDIGAIQINSFRVTQLFDLITSSKLEITEGEDVILVVLSLQGTAELRKLFIYEHLDCSSHSRHS